VRSHPRVGPVATRTWVIDIHPSFITLAGDRSGRRQRPPSVNYTDAIPCSRKAAAVGCPSEK
jgi:hypothetical protein